MFLGLIFIALLSPLFLKVYLDMTKEERKAWRDGTWWEYKESKKNKAVILLPSAWRPTVDTKEYFDRYSGN